MSFDREASPAAPANRDVFSTRSNDVGQNQEARKGLKGLTENSVSNELLTEFLFACSQFAVLSGMVTARAEGRSLMLIQSVRAYVPKPVRLFHATVRPGQAAFFNAQLTAGLVELYRHADFLIQQTPFDAAAWKTDGASGETFWIDLDRGWRAIAEQAHQILLVLVENVGACEWTSRAQHIGKILNATARGEAPCIRNDGSIVSAANLNRRRDYRYDIGVTLWVETVRGRSRALLKDLSVSGYGLASCASLPTGSPVVAELPNGYRLAGIVMWSHGGAVGVRLNENLVEESSDFQRMIALTRFSGTHRPKSGR